MQKNNKTFNAIAAVTDIAKLLEDSRYEIFRLYEPDLGKAYDGDLCRRNKKDLPVDIQYVETELREEIDHLSRFLKTTPAETICGEWRGGECSAVEQAAEEAETLRDGPFQVLCLHLQPYRQSQRGRNRDGNALLDG